MEIPTQEELDKRRDERIEGLQMTPEPSAEEAWRMLYTVSGGLESEESLRPRQVVTELAEGASKGNQAPEPLKSARARFIKEIMIAEENCQREGSHYLFRLPSGESLTAAQLKAEVGGATDLGNQVLQMFLDAEQRPGCTNLRAKANTVRHATAESLRRIREILKGAVQGDPEFPRFPQW